MCSWKLENTINVTLGLERGNNTKSCFNTLFILESAWTKVCVVAISIASVAGWRSPGMEP